MTRHRLPQAVAPSQLIRTVYDVQGSGPKAVTVAHSSGSRFSAFNTPKEALETCGGYSLHLFGLGLKISQDVAGTSKALKIQLQLRPALSFLRKSGRQGSEAVLRPPQPGLANSAD